MGADTSIQWCDDTLNVWHGCAKVDALCKNCYAEVSTPVRVKRAGGLEVWGAEAARSETKSWEANLRSYARRAVAEGKRRRVFAQSLADTFEDRPDLDPLRARFFDAIEELVNASYEPFAPLDLLLLTKRPENVLRMVPRTWLDAWPPYVWIGTSVGTQASADERIPHLLRIPARVRFLSVEPQLEAVDLTRITARRYPGPIPASVEFDGLRGFCGATPAEDGPEVTGIQWVICGGESGPRARPFDLAWARSLRDQCRAAGVAYFLKQLGARPRVDYHIASPEEIEAHRKAHPRRKGTLVSTETVLALADSHGGDESEWPSDLRGCRAFPEVRP